MSGTEELVDLRCSTYIRSQGVDPVGTAGSYSGILVIDWPLPWPRDASEIPGLAEVADAARRTGVRLQVTVPQGGGELCMTLYRWRDDLGRYAGDEVAVTSQPGPIALAMLAGEPVAGQRPIEVTDVLLCGHGRRDRCCGSFGVSLEVELRSSGLLDTRTVRLRRTSHTGGHRFAPTAMILPDGTSWGFLDAETLTGILDRRQPVERCTAHYRGCSGLSSPSIQAVERAVIETAGWEALSWARRGELLGGDRVALSAIDPGRGPRRWEASVVIRRRVPVPKCGAALTGEEKTEPELSVLDLQETTSPS